MKRTLTAILTAFVLVLSCAVAGCKGKDVVDTYTGAVSEATYESTDDAVKGFLETELSGQTVKAVFVSYEKESELKEKEIKKLNLGAEYSEGLQTVEKGTVEYKEESGAAVASLAEESGETVKRIVYILQYTNSGYRYYTPALQVGETITKSYFDSIFDPEQYLNCTLAMSINGNIDRFMGNVTATFLFAEKAAYFSTHDNQYGVPHTPVESFLIESDGALYIVDREGDPSWDAHSASFNDSPIKSMSEYVLTVFNQLLNIADHTCLVKTGTGYKLREGAEKALLMGMIGEDVPEEEFPEDLKCEYSMVLKDGRVEHTHFKLSVVIDEETYIMELNYTISDYGTTKVEVPAEVTAALNDYKASIAE